MRAHNKVLRDIARELQLTVSQRRHLHDLITGEGMTYHEILDFAKNYFGKK